MADDPFCLMLPEIGSISTDNGAPFPHTNKDPQSS